MITNIPPRGRQGLSSFLCYDTGLQSHPYSQPTVDSSKIPESRNPGQVTSSTGISLVLLDQPSLLLQTLFLVLPSHSSPSRFFKARTDSPGRTYYIPSTVMISRRPRVTKSLSAGCFRSSKGSQKGIRNQCKLIV